jgi:AraC family transcriptional regulator
MNNLDNNELMNPRIESLGAIDIVGIPKLLTTETRDQIPHLWKRFGKWIGHVPHQVGRRAYGVIRNNDKGRGFYYLAGVEVSSTAAISDDLRLVSLPAQQYVVFTHRHHVSTLFQTMCAIYSQWLPQSKLVLADSACFELYGEDFNPVTGLGLIEIWLPLEAETPADVADDTGLDQ